MVISADLIGFGRLNRKICAAHIRILWLASASNGDVELAEPFGSQARLT